jgi:hypothetical protein
VSLTSLLRGRKNPVRDWFAENFSETQSVCAEANRELRGGSAKEPCVVPPVVGADPALTGTAIGYLLAAHLRENALDTTVATHAARLLDRPLRGLGKFPPSLVERVAVEHIRDLRPWEGESLDDERWWDLCQLVCILARFEQYYRAGPTVLPYLVAPLTEHSNNLGKLAAAMVKPLAVEDVSVLGRSTVEGLGHLRDARHLFLGPVFVQSAALGGADADIIYDGTLIDLKSTSQARVVGREELWQLLGYLFADTDDAYRVEQVGIVALRRRRTLIWSSQDLIDALAGGSAPPVEHWRVEFARVLEPVARAYAANRAQRLREKREGREGPRTEKPT